MAALVAGIDSSTQACKVVVRDAATGRLVRSGRAGHPDATEVNPDRWWSALRQAVDEAGGLSDVAGLSVAAQQHGMICLGDDGAVVRPALLWNDTRSATAASDLVGELGASAWAQAVGSVPVASFTVAKLRWMAEHEPHHVSETAAVCLPHDWLTWRLRGGGPADGSGVPGSGVGAPGRRKAVPVTEITTDRGDASGTGYWSAAENRYRFDLLERALGARPCVPTVVAPSVPAGNTPAGQLLGPGTGDNAAAALGVGADPGDIIVSIGTSGTAFASCSSPSADSTGAVAGFADATGRYLPLVCTLNAARVLDAASIMLNVDHERLAALALSAPPGADGLVFVPYLEGERTPNKPEASAALHGLTLSNATPANLARAAVEGMLCALADGLDHLVSSGVSLRRIVLIGGGARSAAVCQLAPSVFAAAVSVPEPGEYVADGAARQAAWALSGQADPPLWTTRRCDVYEAAPTPWVRHRYAEARDLVLRRAG